MIHAHTRAEVRTAMSRIRREGRRVGLVPTMGYLHDGHLSLVERAAELADAVVMSIFVNPLQFGPDEDLEAYPRDLERDLGLARERGVDLVFTPTEDEMYPEGPPRVTVDPGPLNDRLCGRYRPGHFRGVLTVVARLLGLFAPDVAVFGRKDFQQSVLIRRMIRDLEMSVEVEAAPVVRAEDGLAMSSRNEYLSREERAQARALSAGLFAARDRVREGETAAGPLLDVIRERVAREPLLELQYAEIVHPETLDPVDPVRPGSVAALAALCGETRLIDNVVLE